MVKFQERLAKFFRNGKFSDLTVRFGDGSVIKTHRVVLGARSQYFHALFRHDRVRRSYTFPSHLIQDANFAQMLFDHLYEVEEAQLMEEIDVADIADLLVHADYFGMTTLVETCHEKLLANVNMANCVQLLQFSHYFPHLEADVYYFVAVNFEEVWKLLTVLSFDQLRAVLAAKELYVSSEMTIWAAVMEWVRYDLQVRERHLVDLLPYVRLGLLSHSELQKLKAEYRLCTSSPDDRLFSDADAYQDWKHSTKEDLAEPDLIPPESKIIRISRKCVIGCGGWTLAQTSKSMELYDHVNDVWLTLSQQLPMPRAYHGSVEVNGRLYVIGGSDGQFEVPFKTNFALDLKTLRWEELPPMHFRRCYVSVTSVEGKIYVMGGYNGLNLQRRLTVCERFDPETNQWTVMQSMRKPRSDASAVSHGGKIWIVGGFNGEIYLNTAETYDVQRNEWSPVPPMANRRGGVGCAVLNNKLYAMGGHDGSSRLKVVECLDLTDPAAAWTPVASMHTTRSNFGVCCIPGDRIVVAGGFEDPSTTAKSEWYDGNEWHLADSYGRAASALTLATIYHGTNLVDAAPKTEVVKYLENKRRQRIDYLRRVQLNLVRNWSDTSQEEIAEHHRQLSAVQGRCFDADYLLVSESSVQERCQGVLQELIDVVALAKNGGV